jgi:cathepsin L
MRAAVVALVAFLAAPALADRQTFAAWKSVHGKSYANADEEALRYAIYEANFARVNAHNAKGLTWTMAMNEFGDLTPQEFAASRIGGYKPRNLRRVNPGAIRMSEPSTVGLPSSVDWTTKGVVTPVKNQGQCGSCWSFSTTGSTESINAINGKGLISLSEQQLMDCSGPEGDQGCNGGLMDDAFQYIIDNKGICSEASYPYTAQDGTCKKCTVVVEISSYTDVTVDSDSALATAVAQQPVSIAIEADQGSFQFYSGGVMTAGCGVNLDHGVLVVGYGADAGQDYWKVKNSWGASWGEAGYIRLGRDPAMKKFNGNKGQCGIYMDPSYPVQ